MQSERNRVEMALIATLFAFGVAAGARAQPQIDLALCIDGSGSIIAPDFALQLDGTASAIESAAIVPRDSTVRIAVVQFASSIQVAVVPTVIDSEATAVSVAATIRGMTQLGGTTNMAGCIDQARQLVLTAAPASDRQIIDLSTDGNPDSDAATIAAAQQAQVEGVDVLNAIAVGSADVAFLQSIVFPQPSGGAEGFVAQVSTFEEYADVIALKLEIELSSNLPTLFVHGICSNGGTWDDLIAGLRVLAPQRYAGPVSCPDCTDVAYDGSAVVPLDSEGSPLPGDIPESQTYTIWFRANGAEDPEDPQQINDVEITDLAYQLVQVIEEIKAVNGVGQVNVVAHSMGGLVTRSYLQGLTSPYALDVRRLVTVDTPHRGALGANFLNLLSYAGPLVFRFSPFCILESSVQRSQLEFSSGFIDDLNSREFPEQASMVALLRSQYLPTEPIPLLLDPRLGSDLVVEGISQDVTSVSEYDYCEPGTSNVGNIWTLGRWLPATWLHIQVLDPIWVNLWTARDVDAALFEVGIIAGEEFRISCVDLVAGSAVLLETLSLPPGTTPASPVTVTLDFGEVPGRGACPVEVRARVSGAIVDSETIESQGIRIVELAAPPGSLVEIEVEGTCSGRILQATAELGPAFPAIYTSDFEEGVFDSWDQVAGDASTVTDGPGRVLLTGGTLAGQDLLAQGGAIEVQPGAALTGSVVVSTENLMGPSAVAPFGYTWSWGSRETDLSVVNAWIPTGTSAWDVPIDLVAPVQPGVYHLLFGFGGEFTLEQVLACSNWSAPPVIWFDGNDYVDVDMARLNLAASLGFVRDWPYWLSGGYQDRDIPLLPIRIVVRDPASGVCHLDTVCSGGALYSARDEGSDQCVPVAECSVLWACEAAATGGSCGGGPEICAFSPGCASGVQGCSDGICTAAATCVDRLDFVNDPRCPAESTVTLDVVADAGLRGAGFGSTNYGGLVGGPPEQTAFGAGNDDNYFSVPGNAPLRGALRFDLSSIPEGSTVVSADLTLYFQQAVGSQTEPLPMYIDPYVATWSESTITWNNRPAVDLGHRVSGAFPLSGFNPLVIDLTPLVSAWTASTISNFGFEVSLPSWESEVHKAKYFGQREATGSFAGAELTVTFVAP